ncbi:MAG: Gfo/Idh/MocA family oxidoreductase [Pseudomonadota bacterium]
MIRVAILGAGIGAQHFESYQKLHSRFNVVSVIDQDEGKARALTKDTPTKAGARINEALEDPSIDLIDICLPPHLHASVTLETLARCKHVICEKPLATSLKDVAAIKSAAQRHNRRVYPVFQYRWGPGLAQLRHVMLSGFAGQPTIAAAETHWNRGAEYYAIPWRGTWAGEQGGAVLGHAIHSHDLLAQIMGPVRAVAASTTTRVNRIETEDCAAITFEFANGALGTSSVTLGSATDETRLRYVFEHVTATSGTDPYCPGAGGWTFTARDPARQEALEALLAEAPAEQPGFEGFLSAVAEDLATGCSGAVRLQDGAASIELVTAIYHAARTGQRVRLPLAQDHPLYGGWNP